MRNKAAHTKYDEYTKEHVEVMHVGIWGFISKIPAQDIASHSLQTEFSAKT